MDKKNLQTDKKTEREEALSFFSCSLFLAPLSAEQQKKLEERITGKKPGETGEKAAAAEKKPVKTERKDPAKEKKPKNAKQKPEQEGAAAADVLWEQMKNKKKL